MSCYIIELADCALTPYAIETESGTEYGWGLMPKRKVDLDEPITMADLNANTAIGYDMVGTLKVGGDAPSVCL